jgi:serine/threonine-protein kinase RIM15
VFEFLTGIPPFNDETPEQIFQNILNRGTVLVLTNLLLKILVDIPWPDEDEDLISPDARDLIDKLLCPDVPSRIGSNGVQEIKSHPFFNGIQWDTLLQQKPPFVPKPYDPADTRYFDGIP